MEQELAKRQEISTLLDKNIEFQLESRKKLQKPKTKSQSE
jgi:hypothetical protein